MLSSPLSLCGNLIFLYFSHWEPQCIGGGVSIVGNAPIPEKQKPFPLFRNGEVDPKTKKVETWWLWDGVNEWPIGKLTKEQKHLPFNEVWNDTLLVERIESGWTPETDDHKP